MRTIVILFVVSWSAGVFVVFGGVTINRAPPFGVPGTVYLVPALVLLVLGGVALRAEAQLPNRVLVCLEVHRTLCPMTGLPTAPTRMPWRLGACGSNQC